MSSERLLEELLAEVRALHARLEGASLPMALTKERAAQELSISESKLKQLIREGKLFTCEVGLTRMVPRSEIERLSAPTMPPPKKARGGGAGPRKRAKSSAEEAQAVRSALRKPRD